MPSLAHCPLAQLLVSLSVQAPAPLQTEAVLALPLAQLVGVQTFSAFGYLQRVAEAPSHEPWQPPAPSQASRAPRGGPLATVVQVPSVPGSLQASHCPSQGRSQHTPSTHWSLAQSAWTEHACPFAAPTGSGDVSAPPAPASGSLPAPAPGSSGPVPPFMAAAPLLPAPPVDVAPVALPVPAAPPLADSPPAPAEVFSSGGDSVQPLKHASTRLPPKVSHAAPRQTVRAAPLTRR